jgi:hypothetical protein
MKKHEIPIKKKSTFSKNKTHFLSKNKSQFENDNPFVENNNNSFGAFFIFDTSRNFFYNFSQQKPKV